MQTIKLVGRVLPAGIRVSLGDMDDVSWGSDDLGFPIIMSARIRETSVEVTCSLEMYKPEYLSTLWARANNLTRACVDVAAFSTGLGLTVYIDKLVLPDGTVQDIVADNAYLAPLCTVCKIPAVSLRIMQTWSR